jgi:hypothetical protein
MRGQCKGRGLNEGKIYEVGIMRASKRWGKEGSI